MWSEEAKLVASDGTVFNSFGLSVAVSGEKALIGAGGDDNACPALIDCNSGSAYVYELASIKLPKTGQTTCYDEIGAVIPCAGTGQDGDIQAGVAWPSPRFTDHGDQTITDNLTGLMWPEDANLSGAPMTWQQALDYVAGMNAGTNPNLGHTDWRLSNIKELSSLFDYDKFSPALPLGHPFLNVQIGLYWTSTTWVSSMVTSAFTVAMSISIESSSDKLGSLPFWPVRNGGNTGIIQIPQTGQTISYAAGDDGDIQAGVAWPDPRFTDLGDGSVADNLTGLMWMKDVNLMSTRDPGFDTDGTPGDGRVFWQTALDYVKKLNMEGHLGFTDWRLPNSYELKSVVDFSTISPALPAGHPFTNPFYNTWSSTSYALNSTFVWELVISAGLLNTFPKTGFDTFLVWPVRDGTVAPVNTPPTLAYSSEIGYGSDGVDPDSGTASTSFSFKVVYTDADNNPPNSPNVHIDGDATGVGMALDTLASDPTLRDGDYTNGEQYVYTTTLGVGTHDYYFTASDGTDTARLPSSGTLSGPTVIETFVLTLNTTGTGTGSVFGAGTYNAGTIVPVSATPDPGSTFDGWSGSDSVECATGSVLMDTDKSCTATFTLIPPGPPVLSISSMSGSGGTMTSSSYGLVPGVAGQGLTGSGVSSSYKLEAGLCAANQ